MKKAKKAKTNLGRRSNATPPVTQGRVFLPKQSVRRRPGKGAEVESFRDRVRKQMTLVQLELLLPLVKGWQRDFVAARIEEIATEHAKAAAQRAQRCVESRQQESALVVRSSKKPRSQKSATQQSHHSEEVTKFLIEIAELSIEELIGRALANPTGTLNKLICHRIAEGLERTSQEILETLALSDEIGLQHVVHQAVAELKLRKIRAAPVRLEFVRNRWV